MSKKPLCSVWEDKLGNEVVVGQEIITPEGNFATVAQLIDDSPDGLIVVQFPNNNTVCVQARVCQAQVQQAAPKPVSKSKSKSKSDEYDA